MIPLPEGELTKRRKNKYGAKRVILDGIRFDSQFESEVYLELKARLKVGQIVGLFCHHPFNLYGSDARVVCIHKVDFLCVMPDGTKEAHEAKGAETALWRLKRKLFEASYPEIPYIVHYKRGR